ncbi:hypothetical protein MMC25_002328 [Agyrium rufum]|nr:hypothetical protein [Agyrium rufum]
MASPPGTPVGTRTPTEAPIIANPMSVMDKTPDDSSKLKTFLSVLKKFIGVADLASVRFSLPPQLVEPIPNLEYWQYLDRPETFIAIGDSDNELGRILAVLRFWFTKDLKYVKGKPCKPYNSTLGEFFRCDWVVDDAVPLVLGSVEKLSSPTQETTKGKPVKVSFLCEQTSHHPPVSAYYYNCPEKGVSARGYDQIAAKFTGTGIRVTPGNHNAGIFVNLSKRDNEEYQLTHPIAYLGGLLRGTLSISVADQCVILCPKTKLKVILHYLEEGWVGKSQNKVVGVIFKYDPENDNKTRIKDVPDKEVLARIEGCWQDKVFYTLANSKDSNLLVDLNPLFPVPKIIPALSDQLPNESRRFWKDVTEAILDKQWNQATKYKQDLEERQRQKAAERVEKKEEWKPRFFQGAVTPAGKPELTPDGIATLKAMQEGNYRLEESLVTGA